MTTSAAAAFNGLAVVVGVAAVLLWGGLPHGGGKRDRLAAGLRTVALLFLIGAAFPPSCRWLSRDNASLTVVFDASGSMGESDGPDGRTRWSAAGSAWDRVAPRYGPNVRVLRLTDRLESGAPPSHRPAGVTSWSGLVSAPGEGPILFFTDGRGPEDDRAAARAALNRPVLAVGVGAASTAPDLSIDEVRAPALGFVGAPVSVAARVSGEFTDRAPVTLTLRGPDGVLGRSTVALSTSPVEVRWEAVPPRPGAWTLRVSVDSVPGERRRSNNERSAWVDVRRDRVRALYIAGRPGPHYGFLRAQLKNDPSVELVSFVVLRDPEDALVYRDAELSLIPFPTADELAAALPTYDAVVLEDVGGARWGLGDRFFQALDAWVNRGGGVLWIGGPAPAEAWIPARSFPWTEGSRSGPAVFRAVPTEGRHPLLALDENPIRNAARWAALAPLESDGLFPLDGRPGTRVLLREPQSGAPVLVVRAEGRGRVAGLSNATSWRWALGGGRQGEGPVDYQRFWRNMAGWLASTPGYGSVRLDRPDGALHVGDPWTARLRCSVERSARPRLRVRPAGGTWTSVRVVPGSESGDFTADVSFREGGPHEVVADLTGVGTDRLWVDVVSAWDETRETSPDFDALRALARSTGGDFVSLDGFSARWLSRRLSRGPLSRGKSPPPPSGPLARGFWSALAVLALAAEWTVRRRRGLP